MTGISFWDQVVEAAKVMTWVEIGAFIAGILYVILAAKENIWCWFWGILNSILSVYLFYAIFNLYAESFLYSYYVVAGFYGWYMWQKKISRNTAEVIDEPEIEEDLPIRVWSIGNHLLVWVIGAGIALVLAYILKNYSTSSMVLIDSFTTVFSFIATYMVIRKVLENWIYWIVIDIVSVGLYFSREAYLYALLMIIYTVVAYFGYREWQRRYSAEQIKQKEIFA